MAEFGLGKGVIGSEVPTLGEAAEALLTHIRASKKSGHVQVRSHPMPIQGIARQGFFTAEEVERLCHHLPAHGANAVRFAWETGWRRGEIFGLRWVDVDLEGGNIVLTDSKNGEPRHLPFAESPALSSIIREQRASASAFELRTGRPVQHVFHYAGRFLPEGLKRSWKAACRKAGLGPRIFHDLRRSFIQRCEDLSVPRSSAMKITGHRTEAVYARYAIAPRASIAAALRKLANDGRGDLAVITRGKRPSSEVSGEGLITFRQHVLWVVRPTGIEPVTFSFGG